VVQPPGHGARQVRGRGSGLVRAPASALQEPSPRKTVRTARRAGSQNLSIRRPLTDPDPRPPAPPQHRRRGGSR
jgi:hypothetical protein